MRTVRGLDIHKESMSICIMDSPGKKVDKKLGVYTHAIREMAKLIAVARKTLVIIRILLSNDE